MTPKPTVRSLLIDTPVGPLTLVSDGQALTAVSFRGDGVRGAPADAILAEAARQLTEFFAGKRRSFELALSADGTPFQRKVWAALARIPYGETRSYADIAREVGSPKAVRAVGAANGQNPHAIVVPCHRVIGANGKLTGYGGGMANKEKLLDLERGQLRL